MFLMFYFLLGSGTFSQDAFRLIQAVQNGTLNEIIRIHEDLCSVVFSTVSAYSVWFVLHWFTYGASVVLTVIYISEEVHSRTKYHTHTIEFVFLGLILVCVLYQFLFPCFCAARMTSNCTGKIFIKLHTYQRTGGSPGTDSAVRGKGGKISEPNGNLGRGKGVHLSARFAHRLFSLFHPVFCLVPHYEDWSEGCRQCQYQIQTLR